MTKTSDLLDYYCSFPEIQNHLRENGGRSLNEQKLLELAQEYLIQFGAPLTKIEARQRHYSHIKMLFEGGAAWETSSYWDFVDLAILSRGDALAKIYCTAQSTLNPGWENEDNNRWLLSHAFNAQENLVWIKELMRAGVRPHIINENQESVFIHHLYHSCDPLELLNRYTPTGQELVMWVVGALLNERDDVFDQLITQLTEEQKEQVLFLCVNTKSLEAVEKIVQLGTPISLRVLNQAIKNKDLEMCRKLLSLGAPVMPDLRWCYEQDQPLANAIKTNSAPITKLLLASGADANAVFRYEGESSTPLNIAFRRKHQLDPMLVEHLVRAGAKTSWHLVSAILAERPPLARAILLDPNCPINSSVSTLYIGSATPIAAAVSAGFPGLVKRLLARGAKVGNTLVPSIIRNSPTCAQILMDSGQVDLDAPYYMKTTLLGQLAAYYADFEACRLLIENGATTLGALDDSLVKDRKIRKLLIDNGIIESKCLDTCTIL